MIPGEYAIQQGELILNKGLNTVTLAVANMGDRPIQVGSHYHFYETNTALKFNREAARGFRLNIPAGTAVRFEPGQSRDVGLVAYSGSRHVFGFNGKIMDQLEKEARERDLLLRLQVGRPLGLWSLRLVVARSQPQSL